MNGGSLMFSILQWNQEKKPENIYTVVLRFQKKLKNVLYRNYYNYLFYYNSLGYKNLLKIKFPLKSQCGFFYHHYTFSLVYSIWEKVRPSILAYFKN